MRYILALLVSVSAFAASCSASERPILFLGDSITDGFNGPVLEHEPFRVLVANESFCPGINGGVSGENSLEGLARLPALLQARPRLAIIMFGTNDSGFMSGGILEQTPAQYRENLIAMIQMCKRARCKVVLMTPPPTTYLWKNEIMKMYVLEVRALAEKFKLPLVDNYQHFSELHQEGQPFETFVYDWGHPNAKGHRKIADFILEVLRR